MYGSFLYRRERPRAIRRVEQHLEEDIVVNGNVSFLLTVYAHASGACEVYEQYNTRISKGASAHAN